MGRGKVFLSGLFYIMPTFSGSGTNQIQNPARGIGNEHKAREEPIRIQDGNHCPERRALRDAGTFLSISPSPRGSAATRRRTLETAWLVDDGNQRNCCFNGLS
jgi:hypothetical protein